MPSGTGKRIWLRPEEFGRAVAILASRRGKKGRTVASFIMRGWRRGCVARIEKEEKGRSEKNGYVWMERTLKARLTLALKYLELGSQDQSLWL
jgi:hypothetical protein